MATNRRTAIRIGIDQLQQLADRVGHLDAAALGDAIVPALNETADRTYQLAADRITTGINLSDAYLRRRMKVEPATTRTLEASITATGDRSFMTRLASYDAAMVIVPRKTTRASRAKGLLPLHGGRQNGVNVTVVRGQTKTLNSGFMLPLRAGATLGDKYGVFMRDHGRLKHLYGPSVYQLFAYQAPRIVDDVAEDLQQTLLARVSEQVDKILT